MLTKVDKYLQNLSLVHNFLFINGDVGQVEQLGTEHLNPEGRVDFEIVEGLLVPLDAD